MLIFTKEMFSNNDNLANIKDNINSYINNNIELHKTLKQNILDHMQDFANATFEVNPDYSNKIVKYLENLKDCLNMCNQNLENLNTLSSSFSSLLTKMEKDEIDQNHILDYNTKSSELNKLISENTLKIEIHLNSILTFSKLNFTNEKKEPQEKIIEKSEPIEQPITKIEEVKPVKKENSNLNENTLLVSETTGKVILPYTIDELNKLMEKNPDKYLSLEDVIEKEYTISLHNFKNFPLARFMEAFKLSRYKEKESLKSAFDLGLELLFNYNLHPAIISACRNMNELDIYLDYLETNETAKFDCFKIVFDIAPIMI